MGTQSPTSIEDNKEEALKNGLNIKVISFKNLTPPKTIKAKLDLNGEILGISPEIFIEKSETDVNWEVAYEIDVKDEFIIDQLACNPFTFTILLEDSPAQLDFDKNEQIEGRKRLNNKKNSLKSRSKDTSVGSISKKSTKSKRSKSKSPLRKGSAVKSSLGQNVLGATNLDVLPLLLGEVQIGISLLIHPVNEELGSQAVAWTNLPRMQVTVTSLGDIATYFAEKVANIMLFTLESIHNITPQFTESLQVGTIFPRGQEFEVVTFTSGTLMTDNLKWISKRKKWIGLCGLKGQGAFSQYMLCENIAELNSTMDYQVSEKMLQSIPRIQWNQVCRKYLNNESQEMLKENFIKHQCWPLEVLLSKSSAKVKEFDKGKGDRKMPKENVGNDHFITFLDPTRLLYPGETNCRQACQLFTYTDTATLQRFGTEIPMFRPRALSLPKSPKTLSKKERSRATTPRKKSLVTVQEEVPTEEELLPEPEPVYNADGDPVYIVVQIELLTPLFNKKRPEEVIKSIEEIVSHKCDPTLEEQAFINATQAFENCIADLISVVNDEYQQFFNINEKITVEKSCKNYMMHLHMTGAHARMKESLRETMEDYIQDVLGVQFPMDGTKQVHQETMAEVYRSLTVKMCSVVNCVSPVVDEIDSLVTCEKLLFFATEAYEEGMYLKAQEYLLQGLDKSSKADPIIWLDYARYWVKKFEFEKAEECAREAVALDHKCIDALLFHGLLSWLTEDLEVAELFLSAAVSLDAHSMEAWLILHIFHKQTNKQLEANVELLNAKKCIEHEFESTTGIKQAPLLTWCPAMADSDRIYLQTAIHMMRFSFPELAELALSYDLLIHGRSVPFLYFLAVCHYLQGRYEQSLQHIDEALAISWQEFRLWSLKGHNHYKLDQMGEAKQAYQFVFNLPDAPANMHQLNLRVGNILLEDGALQEARKCFMTICKLSPSPLSWLGLGIAAFMDDEMREAELALNEANLLDSRQGHVWGYLALVNVMLARPAVFARCMGQALRYGLDDPVLLERLHILGQYSEAMFV